MVCWFPGAGYYRTGDVSMMKYTLQLGVLLVVTFWWTATAIAAGPLPVELSKPGDNAPGDSAASKLPTRASRIPADALKITPQLDVYPPRSHSAEYADPVPLPAPINTAGGEDSPFILPDGKTLYFWFTPQVDVPPQKQVTDGVTGIYVSKRLDRSWSQPRRVMLQEPDKLALDGAEFIQGNTMWFCSARTGYTGLHWFTARLQNGKWIDWKNADFDPSYEVGEFYISNDGKELYFHSARQAGRANTISGSPASLAIGGRVLKTCRS